jgi:hypothetical protein
VKVEKLNFNMVLSIVLAVLWRKRMIYGEAGRDKFNYSSPSFSCISIKGILQCKMKKKKKAAIIGSFLKGFC